MEHRNLAREYLRTEDFMNPCRFSETADVKALEYRASPYWHAMYVGRHIGIHKPDDTICNWTARYLNKDKHYKQRCLGPALDLGRGKISYEQAIFRAFEWFESGTVKSFANEATHVGRVKEICVCPVGEVYTVGHALRDYLDWTRIARSEGGHHNNLVLINHHLVPHFSQLPLCDFNAKTLHTLAKQVLETPPKIGFMKPKRTVDIGALTLEDVRRRKRTFNSLTTILKMAFRHAWDNGEIDTERPWRCLKRIQVLHTPRKVFLDREECQMLLSRCTPALKDLVMAALYSGCRVGELGRLTVNDVGKQGFGIYIHSFKRSPARFVFLPDEGMAFFLAKCDGKTGKDFVFLSDMQRPWRKQHTRLFRRAVARAGLPRALVFHGLRHTYASELIKAGVQMDIVAKQLGHANSRTVCDTYGHLADQFREEQVRKLFCSLGEDNQRMLQTRRQEVDKLWSSLQTEHWRNYVKLPVATTSPERSFASPVSEVVQLFADAEETASGN